MATTPDTELNTLNRQIAELEDKRNKLIAHQKLLEDHPLWLLAEEHHVATCYHDHGDACDWYYHKWGSGNLGYAKGRSLKVAAAIQKLVRDAIINPTHDYVDNLAHDTVVAIFKALKER